MEKFKELGICEPVLKAIRDLGFEEPTDVQSMAIPHVIKGKDVIAQSATGSGKTLAFGAGLIDVCNRNGGLQALVLTPTRELAEQVAESIADFSKYKGLKIVTVYGGVAINPQIQALRTADVVVGTPGRVLDHMSRRTIDFSKVKIAVLDEADRMLDMGFIDDVERIIMTCPKQRQTLLFSATMPQAVVNLSRKYMNNPEEISCESYVDPEKLLQTYYDVEDKFKFSLLVHLLKGEREGLVMVFCNTKRNVDFVTDNLKNNGIDALAIHGGLSQDKRTRAMKLFNGGKRVYVLVCTDVAARGLDIKGVSHVYNYDIPADSKTYIHRIGRTARAGSEGKAVNILASRDYENFRNVTADRSINVVREEVPHVERAKVVVPENQRRGGGRSGQGGSGRSFGPRGPRSSGGGSGGFSRGPRPRMRR